MWIVETTVPVLSFIVVCRLYCIYQQAEFSSNSPEITAVCLYAACGCANQYASSSQRDGRAAASPASGIERRDGDARSRRVSPVVVRQSGRRVCSRIRHREPAGPGSAPHTPGAGLASAATTRPAPAPSRPL